MYFLYKKMMKMELLISKINKLELEIPFIIDEHEKKVKETVLSKLIQDVDQLRGKIA